MPAATATSSVSQIRTGRFVPGESSPPTGRARLRVAPACFRDWFWTEDAALQDIRRNLEIAARTGINTLIIGESGTGKELVARALYRQRLESRRLTESDAPFVAINCGAVPEELAESLLFGHERGAFTSARERQHGRFELAAEGILYLDEVQALSPAVQAKLLRVLQNREFERLGSKETVPLRCQIVAATNVPLEILVEKHRFRQDLYYRLNVCPLYLPALRHRTSDIPAMVHALLRRISQEFRLEEKSLEASTLSLLTTYPWPGNIRQLEHALLYAALRASGEIRHEDLPAFLTGKLEHYLKAGLWHEIA